MVISLACLTTAVGLVSACGAYFSEMLRLPYRAVVVAIGLACILVSNQGLAQLIALSGPVLVGIYPLAIADVKYRKYALVFWQSNVGIGQ